MFETILAPMDLEDSSQAGFKAAIELARSVGGRLVTVAVLTGSDVSAELATHDVPTRRKQVEQQAQTRMERMVLELAPDLHVERHVTFGDPATEIHAVADRVGADVVVITIKNRSRVGKMLMGSKAQEIILQSTRPVLTIPRT